MRKIPPPPLLVLQCFNTSRKEEEEKETTTKAEIKELLNDSSPTEEEEDPPKKWRRRRRDMLHSSYAPTGGQVTSATTRISISLFPNCNLKHFWMIVSHQFNPFTIKLIKSFVVELLYRF